MHGVGAAGIELAKQQADATSKVIGFDQVMHQAHAPCFCCIKLLASEHPAPSMAFANCSQYIRTNHCGDDANIDFGEAKGSGACGHGDIASGDQAATAATHSAVNGRYSWLVQAK